MKTYGQNQTNGVWINGGGARIGVFDPGCEEKLTEQALATAGGAETPIGGHGKSGYGFENGRKAL